MSKLWLAVTPDKYELPLYVADSAQELANILKTTRNNIMTKKHRQHNGKSCGYKVVCVKNE